MTYKLTDQHIKVLSKSYIGVLTDIKCHYCGSLLYGCEASPNEHWCSNPDCPKDAFGLGLKQNQEAK